MFSTVGIQLFCQDNDFLELFSKSKHNANISELHPKVRKTCFIIISPGSAPDSVGSKLPPNYRQLLPDIPQPPLPRPVLLQRCLHATVCLQREQKT